MPLCRFTRPHWRAALLALMSVLPPATALAHGADELDPDHLWAMWSFDPLVWGLGGLFSWLYLRGAARRRARGRPVQLWRAVLYLGGIALIVAALVSPVDYLAEHLFWMHQIQHMILHITGPLLILAAQPQGVVFTGMPRGLRFWTLAPVVRSRWARWLGRVFSHPVMATVVFILTLAAWQIPSWHDAALLNDALHYLMHVTMLVGGLLFFWVLFDMRDPPKGVAHGGREVMLFAATLSAIVIGGVVTMKPMELYPAYDIVGRLWDWTPMDDETTGGILIWIPSSMMFLLAMLLVVGLWNGSEVRRWTRAQGGIGSNSAALMLPQTAEELWLVVTPRNRRLGAGLGVVAASMALGAVGIVLTLHAFP